VTGVWRTAQRKGHDSEPSNPGNVAEELMSAMVVSRHYANGENSEG